MPEVNHKDQPSLQTPASAEKPLANATISKITSAVNASPAAVAKAVAAVAQDTTVTAEQLEAAVRQVLQKQKAAAIEAAKPKEPNWGTLTEREAMSQAVYIPVIEHEIPDYMNMRLKDPEYECVWASRDQRRIGQLMAQGYELLKAEHIHPDFPVPLRFDSEGLYIYVDVVCMRVHKRILYGKRRKALQVSLNQLANRNKPPRVRLKNSYDLAEDFKPSYGDLYSDIA
jgi:hypothetical protein